MTPEPSSCVWMTCRHKSNTPCPSNLDMAALCPVDTQGWICTVVAKKAHHTHMSKQTWYPGEENQGFKLFLFFSLQIPRIQWVLITLLKCQEKKKILLLKKLEQPRGSFVESSFTPVPSGMVRGAGVLWVKKMQWKKKKHRIETLGGDYSYCNTGF